MSSPHSLPPSPIAVNTRRPAQLPLPTANTTQRPHTTGSTGINGPSNITVNPYHSPLPRSPSSPSSSTWKFTEPPILSSSTTPSFIPSHVSSSTHAGGIQPSASFFHPSRPIQQHFPRPPSALSVDSTQDIGVPNQTPDADVFPLAALTKQISNSSEEPSGDVNELHPQQQPPRQFSAKRVKQQSREPLLPIGRPATASPPSTRSSVTRGLSDGNNMPLSSAMSGRTRRVRRSFERMFSLHRGTSFDSTKKSSNSPTITNAPAATSTFEGKLMDEERGIFPPSSLNSGYKNSSTPSQFIQALNLSASRHPGRVMLQGPRSSSSSGDPSSFNPVAPPSHPPLSAVPVTDPKSGKPLRNYQRHPSRNRFFCGGHLLTGGDSPWAFLGSLILVLVISGVWFGTTCVYWWNNVSPAVAGVGAYMALITISTMLATAMRDPGILPRNLDPNPPYPATSPSDGGIRAPMPRDLKVRSDIVRVKYCPTCRTYRPPRSSHCKMCDNCVDGCDHHCQWVNNCVGRRNYMSFFAFLTSSTLTLVLVICTSALHIWLLIEREKVSFRHALSRAPGSAVAFCLSVAVVWPVAALLTYHMRLLLLNVTTIEQIRNQAHKSLVAGPPPPNPFSHGTWGRNILAVLCRPGGYSFLDGGGMVVEDRREVNPGMGKE